MVNYDGLDPSWFPAIEEEKSMGLSENQMARIHDLRLNYIYSHITCFDYSDGRKAIMEEKK
jgi:hypothetical protein